MDFFNKGGFGPSNKKVVRDRQAEWLFGDSHLAGSSHASRTAKIMSQSVCCDIIFVTKAKRQSQFIRLYKRS
ncbi:hypothetical protein DCE79_03000 [Lysinibacillus sp. 2017]|nr:hypothetical protein DCE79_03000 [Lysinibacillus sp. 2017]